MSAWLVSVVFTVLADDPGARRLVLPLLGIAAVALFSPRCPSSPTCTRGSTGWERRFAHVTVTGLQWTWIGIEGEVDDRTFRANAGRRAVARGNRQSNRQ